MPQLVDDIKKLDGETLKRDREILLEYLAEAEKPIETKPEPAPVPAIVSTGKRLDGVVGKVAKAIKSVKNAPPTALVDFVKQFKQEKAPKPLKLEKGEGEIIKSKPVVPKAVEAPSVKPIKKVTLPTVKAEKAEEPKPVEPKKAAASKPVLPTAKPYKKVVAVAAIRPVVPKVMPATSWSHHLVKETFEKQPGRVVRLVKRFFQDVVGNLFAIVAFLLTAYLLFALSLYALAYDSSLARLVTLVFPVPAMFSLDYGVIDYYVYYDAKKAILDQGQAAGSKIDDQLASQLAREEVMKRQIISSLATSYGLSGQEIFSDQTASTVLSRLAVAVINDPQYNRSNLETIKTLKSQADKGSELADLAKRFHLPAGIEFFTSERLKTKFNGQVDAFAGAPAQIVTMPGGWYLIKHYGEQNGLLGLEYIFLEGYDLDKAVNERLQNVKLIILAG